MSMMANVRIFLWALLAVSLLLIIIIFLPAIRKKREEAFQEE